MEYGVVQSASTKASGSAQKSSVISVACERRFSFLSTTSMPWRKDARQVLYETAGKECETLRATIAKECLLESINVNVTVNPNYGPGREGYMVIHAEIRSQKAAGC
jgi:hypothetical protein